ncbi:kidins220, partial [Symbiodinium necroappetens]
MIRHCHREAKTNIKDAKKGDSKTKRLALDAVRDFEIKKKETRIVYKGEATFNTQDPETGNSKELYSSKNISVKGVGVRGETQTTRMSKRATFGTHAQHDQGMSLENVTAKKLPFAFELCDWSNLEMGLAMPCKTCNHAPSSHSHQTCLNEEEEYTDTKIDEHKRAQFEQLTSDEEKQQMALKETEKKLEGLEQETEYRLMEHEAKKERYLDFKRELDGLRAKNKEINVERQRRREDFERESVADAVRKKDDKIDQLNAERQRMWELRRAAQAEAYKAREQVKNEILKQRIQSKFDSKSLEDKLGNLMRNDLFSAKVLQSSHSLPSLRPDSLPEKMPGIEVLGDEPWFSHVPTRRSLRERVVAAHAAQKILVAAPADEIKRICPGPGRILGAGGVLRLGGSLLGGYGEADINYAYRQLSRALHPDKNPDIEEAHDAFKRLTDASAELKEGLEEQRNLLRAICLTMGTAVTPEMLERPQEALFAEATRMLHAVLALTGEGEVPGPALTRSLASFTASTTWTNSRPQVLLAEWFDMNRLLDLFGTPPLRTAYDCAPKRYRAQFLCAMNRATLAEAKRNNDCVRGNWQTVMMQYPEIGLWRDLREKIKLRVWTPEANEPGTKTRRGSMWDDEEGKRTSTWATLWRDRIRNVLPRGIDSFVGAGDKEVRMMAAALWKDITEWAKGEGDCARHLNLFTAEPPANPDETAEAPEEWAFVPAADIFLVVGEGIVGITAEGLGAADAKPGHDRMTFSEAMQDKKQKSK